MPLRILALGDVVGRPGRQVLCQKLPSLIKQRQIDLVVCNAENISLPVPQVFSKPPPAPPWSKQS